MEQIKEVICEQVSNRSQVPLQDSVITIKDFVRTGSWISLTEAEVGITKNAATPSSPITRVLARTSKSSCASHLIHMSKAWSGTP